jgi:hypothetical protein
VWINEQEETELPPIKRSPENARWRLRALFRFYLTLQRHSSSESALEGGASLLLAPPGRLVVASTVVGDWVLTSPTDFDRIDLAVISAGGRAIGYLLATGRVGRRIVGRAVVGDIELTPTAGVDLVELLVVSVVA